MKVVVLDTHAWVFMASDPDKLSRKAAAAIRSAKKLIVPAICTFEVATLVARGRLEIDRPLDWIEEALALPKVEVGALTPRIAVEATRLGSHFHSDPADQLVVATAIIEAATLVTKDARILDYDRVNAIW